MTKALNNFFNSPSNKYFMKLPKFLFDQVDDNKYILSSLFWMITLGAILIPMIILIVFRFLQ